jgi:tRNA-modifying protein YgfZ
MTGSNYNLNEYGLIRISGNETAKFLQGQLTCDVHEVNGQQSRLGAHCDAKGRIQFCFRLFKHQDHYYFRLLKSLIPIALASLQKYAVFSKVKLEDVSDEWVNLDLNIPMALDTLEDIRAGIANVFPETRGLFTPHDINYPQVNGVSFNKGCYTGQEIIARMHFLGKLKQHMYRVQFVSDAIPMPGANLVDADGNNVGTLVEAASVNAQHWEALAVLTDKSLTQPIFLENSNKTVLQVLDLPYTL